MKADSSQNSKDSKKKSSNSSTIGKIEFNNVHQPDSPQQGEPSKMFAFHDRTNVPMNEEEKRQMELEEEDRELKRMGESFWLNDRFVDNPFCVIFTGLFIIAIFIFLTVFYGIYWPSPITNRDFLDYGHINTKLYDARESALYEIQNRSTPSGEIPLQSITKEDWWLNIGVECVKEGCDNIFTPEGIRMLVEIDESISNDPLWPSMCLQDSPTNQTCADDPSIGGKIAKISVLPLFRTILGEDLSEIT